MIEVCQIVATKGARPCCAYLVEQNGYLRCPIHGIHLTTCANCGSVLVWRSQKAPICRSKVCLARRKKEREEVAALEKELQSLQAQYRKDLAEQIALERVAGIA